MESAQHVDLIELRHLVDIVRRVRATVGVFDGMAIDPELSYESRVKTRLRRDEWLRHFDQVVQVSVDAGVRWVGTEAVLPNGERIEIG